jgi:hypothetical protein
MKLIDCDLADAPVAQFKIGEKVYDIVPPSVQQKLTYWRKFDENKKERERMREEASVEEFFEAQHRFQIWEVKHFFPFLTDEEIGGLSEMMAARLVALSLYGEIPDIGEQDAVDHHEQEKKTKKRDKRKK